MALKVISLKHIVANPTGSSHTGVSVESIKASLRNDLWALRSLSHPSCATMLEVIEDASGLMLYIVLEYGTAGTLHDAEDLELGQVRMYAQELLLALQYLHRSVSFRMIDRCALVLRCCISFQRGFM